MADPPGLGGAPWLPYADGAPNGKPLRAGIVLRSKPPSSSGLGHRPFKAAARVRIPLGVRFTSTISKAQWRSWLARRPVTAKVAGSSPVWVAPRSSGTLPVRPGSSVGTSDRLKSGRSAVRPRPWPPPPASTICSNASQYEVDATFGRDPATIRAGWESGLRLRRVKGFSECGCDGTIRQGSPVGPSGR